MDTRIKKLSDLLVRYSCDLQKGEKILISYEGECCKPLIRQIIKDVYACGGFPYVEIRDSAISREIMDIFEALGKPGKRRFACALPCMS